MNLLPQQKFSQLEILPMNFVVIKQLQQNIPEYLRFGIEQGFIYTGISTIDSNNIDIDVKKHPQCIGK